jgi:uncharacterized protein YvpB
LNGHRQFFSIDCEASAAVDWAAYYGTTINEIEFQFKIPLSDNPDYGFVGNVNSPWGELPPSGYGVNAEPIAKLLNTYGVPAIAVRNGSMDLIKDQISHNNPVIAWVVGSMETSIAKTYTDMMGRKFIVAPFEHVVILTGYDDMTRRIYYMSEGKEHEIVYVNFLASWEVLGNMAVISN